VHVEGKRNGRIPELIDTLVWIEPARQPDLVDAFAE